MGASRTSLFKWLGNPKLKDASWDAFQTKYGILILYYNKAGKLIRFNLAPRVWRQSNSVNRSYILSREILMIRTI
jgi:hypothetical protein